MTNRDVAAALALAALVAVSPARASAAPSDGGDFKDPAEATRISLVATVASWAAFGAGVYGRSAPLALAGGVGTFVAPMAGHWYAGRPLTGGLALRTLGVVVGSAGMVLAVGAIGDSGHDNGDSAVLLFLTGAGAYVAGTVYDIATASDAAREYNDGLRVALAPMPMPHGGGLVMAARF